MSALTVSFSCHLAFRFQQLLSPLDQHLRDNSCEVLPHILMSDYCRFVCARDQSSSWINELFKYLEDAFSETDDEVSEVIAVSFIENLPDPATPEHWAIGLLGPKMKRQYRRIYGLPIEIN